MPGGKPKETEGSQSVYMGRLDAGFFRQDVLSVAPGLVGKVIFRRYPEGRLMKGVITEVEAYRGKEDLACHASKGRSERTEIMYAAGGYVYMYLIYGMYWMLNFVTARDGVPQAVLIRGLDIVSGPGRLTKLLELDRDFYGENLADSERLWVEDHGISPGIVTGSRIGVDYAGEYWASRPWRYMAGKH